MFKPNINYASSLEKFSETSVEPDNVIRFLEEYGVWLAGNSLPSLTKKDCSLEASTKFTYIKATKQALLCRFHHYPVLKSSDDGWWHELISSFHKMPLRTTMLDPNIASDPSPLPLYRGITSEDHGVGHG